MVETRTRILGIAPYEGMHAAMDRAAQAYPNVQMDVFTGDLDVGVSIVQRMPPNSYDCIISRGGTANLIRRVTELPVVEVPLSVYDVLSAMKLAENYSSRYAIVGFPNITGPAHTLCDLLGSDLDILTVNSGEEAEETLGKLKEEGYRMVVCDMVTHTMARKMELDAFLITSGVESMHTAIDQAINISLWFGHLRHENMFLRSITQDQNGRVVVLDMGGGIFYSSPAEPPSGLLEALRAHLKEIPSSGSMKFYHTEQNQLYSITAQTLLMDAERYCLYYCVPSRIPLHSHWTGIRSMNRGECEYLFMNSFYSISGAMGDVVMVPHDIGDYPDRSEPLPLIVREDGTYTNSEDRMIDGAELYRVDVQPYQDIAAQYGVGFMVSEFGIFGANVNWDNDVVVAYHDTVLQMLTEQNIGWCYCELYNAVPNHLTLMPVVGGTEFQWSNAAVESVTVTCESGETCEYLTNAELMDVFKQYTLQDS